MFSFQGKNGYKCYDNHSEQMFFFNCNYFCRISQKLFYDLHIIMCGKVPSLFSGSKWDLYCVSCKFSKFSSNQQPLDFISSTEVINRSN